MEKLVVAILLMSLSLCRVSGQNFGFGIVSHSCNVVENSIQISWTAIPDPETFDFSIKDLDKAYPIQSYTLTWYSQISSKILQKSNAKFRGALKSESFPVTGSGIRSAFWRLDGLTKDFYSDTKSIAGEINDFEYRGLRPTSKTYTIENLKYAHVYNFGLRANPRKGAPVPKGGFGNMNITCVLATEPGYPTRPENFDVAITSRSSVLLTWKVPFKKNGAILNYIIEYQQEGVGKLTEIKVPASKREYEIKNMATNGYYSFRIAAANIQNIGEYSSWVKLRLVARQFRLMMAFPPEWNDKYVLSPQFSELEAFRKFIHRQFKSAFDPTSYGYLGFTVDSTNTQQSLGVTYFKIVGDIYFEKNGHAKAPFVQTFLRNAATAPPLILMKQIFVKDIPFCENKALHTDCDMNTTCNAASGMYSCTCADDFVDVGKSSNLLSGRRCVTNTEAPSEFEGTGRNPKTVDLTWAQPENLIGEIKSYELESNTEIDGQPEVKKVLVKGGDFYVDYTFENLPRSSIHKFRVRAITTDSKGAWTEWLIVNTDTMMYSVDFTFTSTETIMNYQDVRDGIHKNIVEGTTSALLSSSAIDYRDLEVIRSDFRGQGTIVAKTIIYLAYNVDDNNPTPMATRILDEFKQKVQFSAGVIEKDSIAVDDFNECGTPYEKCGGNVCENMPGSYRCICPHGNIDVSADFNSPPGRFCTVFDAPGAFKARTLNPKAAQLLWSIPSQLRQKNLKFNFLVQYKKKNTQDATDVVVERTDPNFFEEDFVMKAPIPGLEMNTEYAFRVAHKNSNGIGRFTNWQEMSTAVNIFEIQLNLTKVIYNSKLNDENQESSKTLVEKVLTLLEKLLAPRMASFMNAGDVNFSPGIKDRSYANAQVYFDPKAHVDMNQLMEVFKVNQIPDGDMGLDFTSVIAKDFDECESKWSDCSKDGICENLTPGYRCRCRDRYEDKSSQFQKPMGRICKATAAATATTTTQSTTMRTTQSTPTQRISNINIQTTTTTVANNNNNLQNNNNNQNNNQLQNNNNSNNNNQQQKNNNNNQNNNNQPQNNNDLQNNNNNNHNNNNQQQQTNNNNNNQNNNNQPQTTPTFPPTTQQPTAITTDVPTTPTRATLGTTVSLAPIADSKKMPGVKLSGSAIGLDRIQLSWNRLSQYTTNPIDLMYVVQYTVKGSASWKQTHASANLPHLIINSLLPNVVYRIRLAERRRSENQPYTEFTVPIEVRTSPHIYRMFFQLPTVAPEDVVNQRYSPVYNELHIYISDYVTRVYTNNQLTSEYPQIEFGSAGEISFQAHIDRGTTATFLIYLTDRSAGNSELLKKAFLSIQDKYLKQKEIVLIGITDFDECSAKDYNDCHKWAQCKNSEGSYTCICVAGFKDMSDEYYLLRGRVCTGRTTTTTTTTSTTTTTRPTTTTVFRSMNPFPSMGNNNNLFNPIFTIRNNNINTQPTTRSTTRFVPQTTRQLTTAFGGASNMFRPVVNPNTQPPNVMRPAVTNNVNRPVSNNAFRPVNPPVQSTLLSTTKRITPPMSRFVGSTPRKPFFNTECKPGTWMDNSICVDINTYQGTLLVTEIDGKVSAYENRHRLKVREKAESALKFILKSARIPGFVDLKTTTMSPPTVGRKGVKVVSQIYFKAPTFRKKRQIYPSQTTGVSPLDIQKSILTILSGQAVKGLLREDDTKSIKFDTKFSSVQIKDFNECQNMRKHTYCSQQGSKCDNTVGSFRCSCNGFYRDRSVDKINRPGEACIDPCLPNPCKNGGKCQRTKPVNETCSCTDDWTGQFCTIEVEKGFQNLTLVIAVVGVIVFLVIVICSTVCILRIKRKKQRKQKSVKSKKHVASSDESSDESDVEGNLKSRPFAGIENKAAEIKAEHIAPIPVMRPSKMAPLFNEAPIPTKRDRLAASQSVIIPSPRRPPKPPNYSAVMSKTSSYDDGNDDDFNPPPLPPRLGSVPASMLSAQSSRNFSRSMDDFGRGFHDDDDDVPPIPPKPLPRDAYEDDDEDEFTSSDEDCPPPPVPRKPVRYT